MPQFLTPDQVAQIKRIIAKRHAAVILRLVGPDALTDEERAILAASGIPMDQQESVIRDSYLFGQFMAQVEKPSTAKLSLESFQKKVAQNPVTLSQPEEHAIKAAELHAGAHIRHLGARVEQQASMLVFKEDAEMRAEILHDVKQEVAENVRRRESVQKLKKNLAKIQPDWDRDWNRVALTEKTNAMNRGVADNMRENHGDAWVYKRPMPDACKECVRLHIGPDGHPRIFKLSSLEANGTNVGKKTAEWQAVVGTTHPHCQCQLLRVPPGWGFNEDGDLVPGGKGGVRYEDAEVMQKAALREDALQKSFKVQERINFQGLPIAIEHVAGSLRPWKDADGNEGSTRMLFAYGFVEGTEGPDGDEYDVFVGPDPDAPFVFIVHQTKRGSQEWDEDKAMLGFPDAFSAQAAYAIHYDLPAAYQNEGGLTQIPIEEFVQKVMQTRTSGSPESDGMVKSNNTPSEIYAADSQMGNRAVSPTAGGVNLVVMSPMNHAGATTRAATIKKLKEHLVGVAKKDRERFMMQIPNGAQVYNWQEGQPPEPLFPYEHSKLREEMVESASKDVPQNRLLLDREIAKRLKDVSPNFVITDPALQKAGGPYIGPRGGLWADPQHTVPYKAPKPTMRTPVRPAAETTQQHMEPRKWKEGNPPGIPEVTWTSWKQGHRGGTEELHYDKDTQSFKPERKKLHNRITQKFLKGASAHKRAPGVAPTAIISMGGPASGKSTLLQEKFGDLDSYVRVDSDKIKEELPEYKDAVKESYKSAATIVHMESTVIANDLLEKASKSKKNLIFDTTGADFKRFENQIKKLKAAGYRIAVVMPHVDPATALKRAKDRAELTGRWVPEAAIHDVYSKVPGSFVQALGHVETAYLYDNTDDNTPKPIYEKHGDDHTVHDQEKAKLFPGLPEGLKKAENKSDVLDLLKKLAQAGHATDKADRAKPKKHTAGDGILDINEVHDWVSVVPDEET